MATKSEEKNQLLDPGVWSSLEKKFGKGSLWQANSTDVIAHPAVSTGSIMLDNALGIGGWPLGRIVEIFGSESSGKTTLALHAIAETQKQGRDTAFIDAEHSLDLSYSKNLGVDPSKLWINQPNSGEDGLEMVDFLVKTGKFGIIVIDSVSALVPRAELEGEMGDQRIGLQARLMSQAMRKLTHSVNEAKCLILFINQIREKAGVVFGNPETTSGGRALAFYASTRVKLTGLKDIGESDQPKGRGIKAKVIKNKLAPPHRTAEFEIIFGKGIDNVGSVVDYAAQNGILQASGSWYSFEDKRIGQGRQTTIDFIGADPALLDKILTLVKEKMNG